VNQFEEQRLDSILSDLHTRGHSLHSLHNMYTPRSIKLPVKPSHPVT